MIPHFDLAALIQTIGHIGIFAIIFAESGLLIGFFLPGESLLFTAGLLASQNLLNLPLLLVGTAAAAITGDSVGYWFGAKVGPRIFTREESFLFRRSHLERTKEFYKRHGTKTIILARFIPIVRTFAPILAGVGQMNYKTFLTYNIVGGFAWTWGATLLGYFLGRIVPGAERYLLPLVIIIVLTSFIPPITEMVRARRQQKKDEE